MSEARLRPGRGPGGAREPQDKVRSGPGGTGGAEGRQGPGGTGESGGRGACAPRGPGVLR